MKIYIIWEMEADRPVISRGDFGLMYASISKENAQAKLRDLRFLPENISLELKEFEVKEPSK